MRLPTSTLIALMMIMLAPASMPIQGLAQLWAATNAAADAETNAAADASTSPQPTPSIAAGAEARVSGHSCCSSSAPQPPTLPACGMACCAPGNSSADHAFSCGCDDTAALIALPHAQRPPPPVIASSWLRCRWQAPIALPPRDSLAAHPPLPKHPPPLAGDRILVTCCRLLI
jgi:hypothetical protein